MNNSFAALCGGCGGHLHVKVPQTITLGCQRCGKNYGYIKVNDGSGNAVICRCVKCDERFLLREKLKKMFSCHNLKCGYSVIETIAIINVLTQTKLKKPSILGEHIGDIPDVDVTREVLPSFSMGDKVPSIKVVIPYYNGDQKVQRSARCWIRPETVFALTDQSCIPPGHNICHQFFTSKNSKSEGIGKKTKPFLIDLLKKLVELFPNEDYYGYFNSDVILPTGVPVVSLIPSKGKIVSFFHRLDCKDSFQDSIATLQTAYQVYGGKDGFVAKKEVIQDMISEVHDLILGAPYWDDGLAVWCFKKYGTDKVDLRYKEVLHTIHEQAWKPDEPESKFNVASLKESGIEQHYRLSINWTSFGLDSECEKRINSRIGIIQPGRIGDIIIVLPIAKFYYDAGYQVFWPIPTEYLSLFDYINYACPIDIGPFGQGRLYDKSNNVLRVREIGNILDLGIGFGRNETSWQKSETSFDRWKYFEAKVPFEERFKLDINRNFRKEWELQESLGLAYKKDYVVTHSEGSKGGVNFGIKDSIEIRPIPDFTLFDWIGVIEKAHLVYCVDSCVAHLVNQLGLAEGRRVFKPLDNYFGRDPKMAIPDINWENESPSLTHPVRLLKRRVNLGPDGHKQTIGV
jgi:hypothetical protein